MIDLAAFEQKLLAFKKEVLTTAELASDAAKPVELDQNRVGRLSRMDAMQAQAMAKASAERQGLLLKGIDNALLRIKSGDYGRCLECDQAIASARLEIDLTAEYCIECATAFD